MKEDLSKFQTQTTEELKEAKQALDMLRETVESKDADYADSVAKIEKLEKTLDAADAKSEEMVKAFAAAEKEAEEMKSRIDEMEARAARVRNGDEKDAISDEMKSFEKYMQFGTHKDSAEKGVSIDEVKFLRTDDDSQGGFLAPEDYRLEIIKRITEVTPFRQVASVMTTARGIVELPKRESNVQAAYRGEGESLAESNQTYGVIRIPVNHLDVIVIATNTMMSDAAFNMEQQINMDFAENAEQVEGRAYIFGDGLKEPQGILTNTEAERVTSAGAAGVLDADDYFELQGALKTGYRGAFMLNRRTRAATRKLKGSDGQYLFAVASESMPSTIAGDPFIADAIDMPDVAAGSEPIAYGDWARAYRIVDGTALNVLRDPYTLAGQGKTRFIFNKRHGGKVVLSEAYKVLTINS